MRLQQMFREAIRVGNYSYDYPLTDEEKPRKINIIKHSGIINRSQL